MSDYELLQGLKIHDEVCYKKIVQQYTRYVAAVVSKVAGNQLSVREREEISWEVFVKVWEHAEHIEVYNHSLKNYLGVVARNLTLNTLRKTKKMADSSLEIEYIHCKSAEDEYLILDTLQQIENFVSRSKEPDREIFMRRYFYLEKVKDIANALNMSEKNISVRIARFKKKLIEALEKGGH
ncbi:MAG: RNA polymerase sigma factor [Cellulosilyticaceae bacterium]